MKFVDDDDDENQLGYIEMTQAQRQAHVTEPSLWRRVTC